MSSSLDRLRAGRRSTVMQHILLCVLIGVLGSGNVSQASEMRRLSGMEIRTTLTGKMLTDYAHMSETYERSGKLVIDSDGDISKGTWRVSDDHLCKRRPGILDECYEMWIAANHVELRHPIYPAFEADLRAP
jgi:hypothetical protein|nr:hypothetical protein [Methylobacterium radiotolerans JCM 2831]